LGFDYDLICHNCQSRDYELLETEKEDELLFVCKSCNSKKVLAVVSSIE